MSVWSSLFGVRDDGGPVAVLEGVKRKRRHPKRHPSKRGHLGSLAAWYDHVNYGRSVQGCIEAFLQRRPCKIASVRSTGDEFFSYAMKIGEWVGPNTLAVNCHKVSVTTSKTQTWLLRAASGHGVKTLCDPTPEQVKLRRKTREI